MEHFIESEDPMKDEIMSGSGKGIMIAAVVGAAVGAGVALLFAPCSGKDTRGWLARQQRTMSKKAKGALEQAGSLAKTVTGREMAHDTPASTVRRMTS